MKAKIQCKEGYKIVNLNRRIAIHEKCLNCSGWYPSEVRNCPLKDCDLHPYRTGEGPQNADRRNKAIRSNCLKCMNVQVGEVAKCQSKGCPLHPYRLGRLEIIIPDESVPRKRFNRPFPKIQTNCSGLTPIPCESVPRKRFNRPNDSGLTPTSG